MSSNESNTVEQMILDAVAKGGAAGSAVVREELLPGGSLGGEIQTARWDYVSGPQLPRQPGEVVVEPWVREALLRLNPEITAQPDRADELIYKLRACLLSLQADGLVRANENLMAWLRSEKTMPLARRRVYVPQMLAMEGYRRTYATCLFTRQPTPNQYA